MVIFHFSVLILFSVSFRQMSMSGRSTQSIQVVTKTPYNIMETYGVSLPVQVTEALTFADSKWQCHPMVLGRVQDN